MTTHPSPFSVLLTGATSFTGAFIARALADSPSVSHVVVCLRPHDSPSLLLQQRSALFRSHPKIQCVRYDGLETVSFLEVLRSEKPDVVVSHGAYMENYRGPDYDYGRALSTSVFPLRSVLDSFQQSDGKLWVHTGTVFEPREGDGDTEQALSIYGAVKAMTFEALRFLCSERSLPLLKMVIPNPIGPFENEDRLIPQLISKWKQGHTPGIFTPHLVRDHLPVTWLAACYEKAIVENRKSPAALTFLRPSGLVLSFAELSHLVAQELGRRLNLSTPLHIEDHPTTQPRRRVNTDDALTYLGWEKAPALKHFWDAVADATTLMRCTATPAEDAAP